MSDVRPKAWWVVQKFGKLRMKEPRDLNPRSKRKESFVCECGKEKLISTYDVTVGKTVSCSRCNEMDPVWWSGKKFGSLMMKDPETVSTGSHRKIDWSCSCGKVLSAVVKDVTSGSTVSCGRCNEMGPEWWAARRFGRLSLKGPRSLNIKTKRKELFLCSCGSETLHSVISVTSGAARSCGRCTVSIQDWFTRNKAHLAALRTPVPVGSMPNGGPWPMETISRVDRPFLALCPHCESEYRPRLSQIKRGHSLTCGCSAGMVSGPNVEIRDFVQSIGFDAELEFKLSGYRFDVHVKKCKTLIEFHGSRWHSSEEARSRDLKKKHLAEVYGYALIEVKESAWRKERGREKERIRNLLRSRRDVGHSHRCKGEIRARIEELDSIRDPGSRLSEYISSRKASLMEEMRTANDDMMSAVISSHHVMCAVKGMDPGEAFGNDPFVYYGLGLVGEAGELTGALLRVIRSGGSHEEKREAVEEELADCFIYSVILAYSTGIDLVRVVNEKARKVEARARAGYYGGPLRDEDHSENDDDED